MLIQSNNFMSFSCQKSLPFDQWKSILRCMTAFFISSTRAPYSEYNCSERRWDFRVPHLMVLCFAFPEISQPGARGRENGLNLHWQALLVDFYLFFFCLELGVAIRADLCPCCFPYSEAVKEQIGWAVSAGRQNFSLGCACLHRTRTHRCVEALCWLAEVTSVLCGNQTNRTWCIGKKDLRNAELWL